MVNTASKLLVGLLSDRKVYSPNPNNRTALGLWIEYSFTDTESVYLPTPSIFNFKEQNGQFAPNIIVTPKEPITVN